MFLRSSHTQDTGRQTYQMFLSCCISPAFCTRMSRLNRMTAAATAGFVHVLPGLFPEAFVTWIESVDAQWEVIQKTKQKNSKQLG